MNVPIFAATVFFVVDEVIFHKINLKGKAAKMIFLIPVASYILFAFPYYQANISKQTSTQINEKGPPTVSLNVNEEEIPIKSAYCWTSDGEGCSYGTDPFPLPENSVDGVKEVTLTGPTTFDFTFKNSVGEPTLYAYYYDGTDYKEVRKKGTTLVIPSDIPEQGIKFVVKWENYELVKFLIGVRTGIPTNGRTF